nr:MAG TPA: hypothetical protein [Caudoviricetes sp.]DAG55077.1 MAG TPA: hypothetical protein [Caudoviricetes sp.]
MKGQYTGSMPFEESLTYKFFLWVRGILSISYLQPVPYSLNNVSINLNKILYHG